MIAGARLIDMVVSPHALLESQGRLRLHANYYITKQIIPALERVISLVSPSHLATLAMLPSDSSLSFLLLVHRVSFSSFPHQWQCSLMAMMQTLPSSHAGALLRPWVHCCTNDNSERVSGRHRLARTCAHGLRPCPGRSACCPRSVRLLRWAWAAAAPLQAPSMPTTCLATVRYVVLQIAVSIFGDLRLSGY